MSEFEEYLKLISSGIYNTQKELFDEVRRLLLFSERLIDELNKLRLKAENQSEFQKFILYAFFRSTSIGASIWKLAGSGQQDNASILLRSLSEIYVSVRYAIKSDAVNREDIAKEYFEYGNFLELKNLRQCIPIIERNNEVELLKNFQLKISQLEQQVNGRRKTDYWPGKPLEQIARRVDTDNQSSNMEVENYYRKVFGYYSMYTHFNSQTLSEYFNSTSNSWEIGPSTRNLDGILVSFYDAYLTIMICVQDAFLSHELSEVNEFIKMRDKLMAI